MHTFSSRFKQSARFSHCDDLLERSLFRTALDVHGLSVFLRCWQSRFASGPSNQSKMHIKCVARCCNTFSRSERLSELSLFGNNWLVSNSAQCSLLKLAIEIVNAPNNGKCTGACW